MSLDVLNTLAYVTIALVLADMVSLPVIAIALCVRRFR